MREFVQSRLDYEPRGGESGISNQLDLVDNMNIWIPPPRKVCRILRPGATFISVSCGTDVRPILCNRCNSAPSSIRYPILSLMLFTVLVLQNIRIPHFSHRTLHWDIDHANVPRRTAIHVYMMTKSTEEGLVVDTMDTEFVTAEDVERRMGEMASEEVPENLTRTEKSPLGTGFVKTSRCNDVGVLRGLDIGW